MKILSNNIVNQQAKSTINPNFKSLKVSPKVNKEIARSATNVFTIASATAISALAGIAITKKQKEEEEKQLIQQLRNPDEFIVALANELGSHKNIRKIDVYTLAQYFEYAPGFISDLILLKDNDGKPRNVKMSEIENIMKAYNENPKLVEELVTEKTDKGKFRFSGEEISVLTTLHSERPDLYEVAKINPTRVLHLSQKCNEHGKKIYSADDIKTILDVEENGTEYGKKLLKMKDYRAIDYRFTPEQAKFLMKKHEQYPEFIESIINEKYNSNCYKYTTEEIIKCASLINDKNIEAAKILFNTKVIHSYRHYSNNKTVTEEGHRYELYEINSLLKAHSKSLYDFCHYVMKTKRYCPENVKELLDLFDVKSIPQDFITRIKNDIEENWDYRWFRESLSMLESRAQ